MFVTGEEVKTFLIGTGLPQNDLKDIWAVSNVMQTPNLSFPEFCIAVYYVEERKQHKRIPIRPADQLLIEVKKYDIKPKVADYKLDMRNMAGPIPVLPADNSGYQQQQRKLWHVNTKEKNEFEKFFKMADTNNLGYLSGETAKDMFVKSGLDKGNLSKIWYIFKYILI